MKDLARKVGVSAWQTVQQWEREGGTAPKRARLSAVAEALNTTPEYLLYGPGKMADFAETIRDFSRAIETSKVEEKVSLRAYYIGRAFDDLATEDQRDAVESQLRAFGVWPVMD